MSHTKTTNKTETEETEVDIETHEDHIFKINHETICFTGRIIEGTKSTEHTNEQIQDLINNNKTKISKININGNNAYEITNNFLLLGIFKPNVQ